jgi:hypothetical protein
VKVILFRCVKFLDLQIGGNEEEVLLATEINDVTQEVAPLQVNKFR